MLKILIRLMGIQPLLVLTLTTCSCTESEPLVAGDQDSDRVDASDASDEGNASDVSDASDASDAVRAGVNNLISPNDCRDDGTNYATARCLSPSLAPDYYVDQANAYFNTLDINAWDDRLPEYHEQVSRWEWPPWLLLTGYTRDEMNLTADVLRDLDPSTVPVRDCRFFDQQPFARCYVVFEYEEGPCPIYEEFIFNDRGEITWIEAWSDLPERLPQSMDDQWAEAQDYPRLGTRVPGLGQMSGPLSWEGPVVEAHIEGDMELADFIQRTSNWRLYWAETLGQAPRDFFALGCGWDIEAGSK